jgi:dTDP-4-dehydrorhamnose 3,5-epimerase
MRTWCQREFETHGPSDHVGAVKRFREYPERHHAGASLSIRSKRGSEVDSLHGGSHLRPASPTYCQHVGITLSADNRRAVYVPKCCAYGFLTLEQNSEVPYHMPELHVPASARGFRWDDPAFKIAWPAPIGVMWERDRTWSTFIKSSSTLPS